MFEAFQVFLEVFLVLLSAPNNSPIFRRKIFAQPTGHYLISSSAKVQFPIFLFFTLDEITKKYYSLDLIVFRQIS